MIIVFAVAATLGWLILLLVLASHENLQSVVRQQHTQIEKAEQLIMTVAALKALIADDSLVLATVASEVLEVKAILTGQVGATPAQLDEIGADVTASRARTVTAIQSISDQVAGTVPVPLP